MLVELTYDDFRITGVKITVAQTTVSRGNVYDVTFYFFTCILQILLEKCRMLPSL